MPGYPQPVGSNAGLPPIWNATLQGIQHAQRMNAALAAGATQGTTTDQYGNTVELYGSNLDQEVTIGAAHAQAGVLVRTGIATSTAGRAVLSGPAITTITLTKGSTSATVGTVTGASLTVGQVIGAADVSDPSSGTATPAIVPGTTISAISGSSVTLSQAAAESGTSLYCAAARFILQQDSGWVPLTLPSGLSGLASGTRPPAARLEGDRVMFQGTIYNASAGTLAIGATVATLPSGMWPSVQILMPQTNQNYVQVSTGGALSLGASFSTSQVASLEGMAGYTL